MINTLPVQISNCNNIRMNCSAPAFTGLKPNGKIPQKTNNFAKKLYQTLFLGNKSDVCKIKDGFVYTQNRTDNSLISKKYKFLHRKPEAIIKDNTSALLREKVVFNENGTSDIEIQDIYTKGYRVCAGYTGVKNGHGDGTLKISYGDKEFKISKEKCETLYNDFNEFLSTKFSKTSEEMRKMNDHEFNSYMNEYLLTPETTAFAVLKSPQALKEQLGSVNRALPYAIECIMEKLGKQPNL